MKPTQEQVIAWAREAGMDAPREIVVNNYWTADYDDIERLVILAYEAGCRHENEACAKLCESLYREEWPDAEEWERSEEGEAIRARREQ